MWAELQHALNTGGESGTLAVLADAGVKGIVLLALAGVATMMMRRSAAATRHLVWMLALVGLLILPVGSFLAPKWQLPLLPAIDPITPAQVLDEGRSNGGRVLRPATEAQDPFPAEVAQGSIDGPDTGGRVFLPATATPDPVTSREPHGNGAGTGGLTFQSTTNPSPWLLRLWLTGALLALSPLLLGTLAVARLRRTATPFHDPELPTLTNTLARSLGLMRPIGLRCTEKGTMPMAAGVLRPVVYLPADAEEWSDERRRAVLLHELAHVKRRDCLTHFMARLAVSLHWFNPLAWYALRQLRIEREHACDDLVLTAGERPTEYAEHLLDIAREFRAGRLTAAAAITMAQKSHLEGRLLAVLDEARKRTMLTRQAVLGFGLVGVLLTATLATLHVTRAESTAVVDHLTFSSGVEVTLLGVGTSRDDDTPPWKADGTALDELPETGSGMYLSPLGSNGQLVRQFYQRATTPKDLPDGEPVSMRVGGLTQNSLPAGYSSVTSVGQHLDENASRVDIDVGVAAGAWEPLVTTQLESGNQATRDGVTYDVLVGKPFERDGDYLFTLTHNVRDLDKRVVVYDTAGELHYTPGKGGAPGINGANMGEYSLGEVAPEDVRFVELQVREFEWRTFRNIPVNPDAGAPPSPAYEKAVSSDENGSVTVAGRDFEIGKVRRMSRKEALDALQFPVWPLETPHADRFPQLTQGDWDCLLIDIGGEKVFPKDFDVTQIRVFDHATRKTVWDSDWRYNVYPERDKIIGGFCSALNNAVFLARQGGTWPNAIDLWFRIDTLAQGNNTHKWLPVDGDFAISSGGDGRVAIEEIRAGSWNRRYSESGGPITWIAQNPGTADDTCSIALRRTGTWKEGRLNVCAVDAQGNLHWPDIHFVDFQRAALQVVNFPIPADKVKQLKFALVGDQDSFRKTFYFDGMALPTGPAPGGAEMGGSPDGASATEQESTTKDTLDTYRLELRPNEIVAQSEDQRVSLIRVGSRHLRLEAGALEVENLNEEILIVKASGSMDNPVRLGVVLSGGGSQNRERLEYLHRRAEIQPSLVASYILQRGWDGALISIPAAVTVPSAMTRSAAWKDWAERKDVRQIEWVDDLGRRYVVHGLGWGRSGVATIPTIPRMERFRSDASLDCYTEFNPDGQPTRTVFYAADGETVTRSVRLRWTGREGTPYVQDFTWRAPDGTYRKYDGTPGGVIQYESIGEFNGKSFDHQEFINRAPDADPLTFKLDTEAAAGPLADFTRSVPESETPAPTPEPAFAAHWVLDAPDGKNALQRPWHADSQHAGEPPLWLDPKVLLNTDDVAEASVVEGPADSNFAINVSLTEDAAARFGDLTANGIGRKIALVAGGRVLVAPTVQAAITGGRVMISGRFDQKAAEAIAAALQPPEPATSADKTP